MTVSSSEAIKINLFIPQGETNTRLPIGQWIGSRQVVGDLTGGYVQCIFTTPQETPTYLFSWEEGTVEKLGFSSSTGNIIYRLVTNEAYTDTGGTINQMELAVMGASLSGSVVGAMAEAWQRKESLFKYIFQPRRQSSPLFDICFGNNENGLTHRFFAWGYLWHPQARRMAGGPTRLL